MSKYGRFNTEEPTRAYEIAWGDPTSKTHGLHVDTLNAAVIAASVADDEDDFIALIGLRDPDAVGNADDPDSACATFAKRFESIKHALTLDEYEHELRLMYRRFGGKEGATKCWEGFEQKRKTA